MKKFISTLLVLSVVSSFSYGATTNGPYSLVTYQALTNFFSAFLSNGFGTNNVFISSGLLAVTNTNGIVITTNGLPIAFANGGSGTNSASGFRIAAGATLAVSNNAFFAGNNPTNVGIATNLPTADFAGQFAMTYGANIGGIFGGQLFVSGSDLTWRRGIMTGPIAIFQYEPAVLGAPVVDNPLNVRAGTNTAVDNLIMMQNMDSNHYDAITWNDSINTERGAMGFGNNAVPFYRGINYFEDIQNANGFYFVGSSNVLGGMDKGTGDFVWYQGTSTSSNNPFIGLTQIFRVQRSTGKLIGNGSGLTGIVATATNGWAASDNAAYFGDISHNTIADISTFPSPTFAGQGIMTYDSTIGGQSAGQLFYAGNDLTWRRFLQLGHVSILETNSSVLEGLLVKTTNGITSGVRIISLDKTVPSSIAIMDSTTASVGTVGYGNSSNTIYRGVNFLDDVNTNHGFYFTSGGSLNGGAHATNGNFVWYFGTSSDSNNPYTGLIEAFKVDRSSGAVTVANNLSVGNTLIVTSESVTNLTAGTSTVSGNSTINGAATIAANLAFTTAHTNLPVTTNIIKYWITITNAGVSGSIPVYQ